MGRNRVIGKQKNKTNKGIIRPGLLITLIIVIILGIVMLVIGTFTKNEESTSAGNKKKPELTENDIKARLNVLGQTIVFKRTIYDLRNGKEGLTEEDMKQIVTEAMKELYTDNFTISNCNAEYTETEIKLTECKIEGHSKKYSHNYVHTYTRQTP